MNCGQACMYNSLDGCKVKEHNAICPISNTATPITEYRMTNADRIRAMSDEELAVFVRSVIVAEDCPVTGGDCDKCFFNKLCFNGEKWYGKEIEWLQQPAEQ